MPIEQDSTIQCTETGLEVEAFECSSCSNLFERPNIIVYTDMKLCAPCDREHFTCMSCADHFPNDDCITSRDNDTYCGSCADDCLAFCDRCETYLSNGDIVELSVHRTLANNQRSTVFSCRDCAVDTHFECHGCNEWRSHTYQYTGPDGENYCENCCDRFSTCENCNDAVWSDDLQYNERDDASYCSNCYNEHSSSFLSDRSYKKLESATFEKNPHKTMVGFEVEFYTPSDATGDFRGLGIIKDDGSIQPEDNCAGSELATHAANGDKLFEIIDSVGTTLKTIEAETNKSCGFHVHIDMRNTFLDEQSRVFTAWKIFEPIFIGMVSASRVNNQYCKPVCQCEKLENCQNVMQDRYRTLNISAFSKHRTFEFRLHHGTISASKIKNWILLLLNFVETFKRLELQSWEYAAISNLSQRDKLRTLFQMLKMPLSLKHYMIRRLKQFDRYKFAKVSTKRNEASQCAA